MTGTPNRDSSPLRMSEGSDAEAERTIRKEDHQAFIRQFVFEIKGGKHHIVETVAGEKTVVPPACKFAST